MESARKLGWAEGETCEEACAAWLRPTRNHMVFAGCHWHHERFTDIAKRAGAALDAMGVGPAERPADEGEEEPAPDGQEPA